VAAECRPGVQLIGVEPADGMRSVPSADEGHSNIRILNGRFEKFPRPRFSGLPVQRVRLSLDNRPRRISTRDRPSVESKGRNGSVLRRTKQCTRICTQDDARLTELYGAILAAELGRLAKALDKEETVELFSSCFRSECVSVQESYHTYYDTLEGHWVGGYGLKSFLPDSGGARQVCISELRSAIGGLMEGKVSLHNS